MSQSSTPAVTDAIYDASSLGRPRMFLLGLQHLFAMFGATVLVPVLTGLSVSTTLLFAGLGTLLFHFLSRGKVPAFLGSSFAFIAGYAAIAPNGEAELLPYACLGVACAGLLYPVLWKAADWDPRFIDVMMTSLQETPPTRNRSIHGGDSYAP